MADPTRPFKIMAAGGIAGAISRTCTAPVDRLKMLLQIQDGATALTLRGGMQKMAAEGTIKAYFRGNGVNVVKIAPETALRLTLNDRIKAVVAKNHMERITPWERMACGGLAGASAQAIIYPMELVRTRLAVSSQGQYKGMADCIRNVLKYEGFRAFYRGLTPSLLGIIPFAGVDIAAFEIFKEKLLSRYHGDPPPLAILGAGMMSSSIAQFASYPLALVRTRLQAQGANGAKLRYTGMTDVLRKTVQADGFKGLYRGVLPNMMKLAPAAGISWFMFEEVKRFLGVDIRS
ncbi:hypothetical protein ABBQ38_011014 [Trebouxia sp. C0009 RCD-2024]